VKVSVLGPRVEQLPDGTPALPPLGDENDSGVSAGRTINGHSVVLRIAYGNVVTLLTGGLHAKMEESLIARNVPLVADVLKVPHHGADDVSRSFIKRVEPLISIISAGDEDARRDYHVRAGRSRSRRSSSRFSPSFVAREIALSRSGRASPPVRSSMSARAA
jgi:hypothetical protein